MNIEDFVDHSDTAYRPDGLEIEYARVKEWMVSDSPRPVCRLFLSPSVVRFLEVLPSQNNQHRHASND